MAYEYSKVLTSFGCDFIVIGRGEKSASFFKSKTGISPITGGANRYLLSHSNHYEYKAIVAVTGDQLGKVTLALIEHRVKSILVEKPGGLNDKEINLVNKTATKHSVKVFVGYNRRFYKSVKKAREIIKQDGGILSFHFEFNELSDLINSLPHRIEIKHNWLLHNSSHVIDLAFFLGGTPRFFVAKKYGSLPWHPRGAIFIGNGFTKQGIPFSYHANWQSPGRWKLEFMTKNSRLIFCPLEKLQLQTRDSFEIQNIVLDDKLDIQFKPGLYKEVESFLKDQKYLCTLNEQVDNLHIYKQILAG